MAKNARPIHFSDQALKLIRQNDRMSARVNQIFERYATIVAAQRAAVVAEIGEDNLRALASQPAGEVSGSTSGPVLRLSALGHRISEELGERIDGLSTSAVMTLLEIVEELAPEVQHA